jgi:hypothetical protein
MNEVRHQELQDLADAELEEAFIHLTRYITRTRQGGDESTTAGTSSPSRVLRTLFEG